MAFIFKLAEHCMYLSCTTWVFLTIHFRMVRLILPCTHMGALVFQYMSAYPFLYPKTGWDCSMPNMLPVSISLSLVKCYFKDFWHQKHSAPLSWEVTLPLDSSFEVYNCTDRGTRHREAQEWAFCLLCDPWLCSRWENYLVIPAIRKFTMLGHEGIWL